MDFEFVCLHWVNYSLNCQLKVENFFSFSSVVFKFTQTDVLKTCCCSTHTKVKYAKVLWYVEPWRKKKKPCVSFKKNTAVVFVLYCLCGSWLVFWHSRVWCVLNCLEETWEEERAQREEEGGEEGHSLLWGFLNGILSSSRHLQHCLTKGRAVWMCQNAYLSGASSPHKYLFWVSCQGNGSHRLQGWGRHACSWLDSQAGIYDSWWS